MRGVVLLLVLSACAELPDTSACHLQPYSGPPLHKPLTADDLTAEPARPITASMRQRLLEAVEIARAATKAPSMTVSVWPAGQTPFTAEYGTASHPLHYWASAGKILTAVAVLQLAERGKLSLKDPVSRYVEGVPNGDVITIRMLLNHTSGLFSANEDRHVGVEGLAGTLSGELAIVRSHAPYNCPGAGWRYSNSGYSLLGAVIETVTGQSYREVITAQIIRPSGAKHMRVLTPDDPHADVVPLDPAGFQIDGAGPAGAIVADAESITRVMRALFDDRLLHRETRTEMTKMLYPMFTSERFYGLGLEVYEVPQRNGKTDLWIGHGGGVPGAKSLVIFVPSEEVFIAVALTGDGSAHATANLLLSAYRGESLPPRQ